MTVKYINLSNEIVDDIPVYPGDSPVNLTQDKSLISDGYNNFRLTTGMHAGTHIDTPMHMTSAKTYISEFPLDRFTGKGCLLDVRNEKIIGYREEFSRIVNDGDVVLLFTGHSSLYGTEGYYQDHPVIDKELAEFFIEKKVRIVGLDCPSPDKPPFAIHKLLLTNDIFILENLTGLGQLSSAEEFEVLALPLKVKADASIVRAIARVTR